MNRHTGTKLDSEQEHIRQAIADILLTPIGSRIERRDYGSQLYLLMDRPISNALLLQLVSASATALKKWEKRIEISQFTLNFNQDSQQLIAHLRYRHKQDNQMQQMSNIIIG